MKDLLCHLLTGQPLSRQQAEEAFTHILSGTADERQTAALLSLLATRTPTVDELVGAATVMRRNVVPIDAPADVIDTCGTGGVASRLFNVSTTAAIVAAAAGAKVAKHGNRAVTSKSGSSDVLTLLGVNIHSTPAQQARCLREANICFAFAAGHHPAMKHVAAIRQALGFATIFNILGPITNPAGARRQLVGVRSPELADLLLDVLIQLGAERALVVNGSDSSGQALCELSTTGPTHIAEFDGRTTRHYRFDPAAVGIAAGNPSELEINSAAESATIINRIFAGEKGSPRDIVLLNAAAALWTAGLTPTIAAGIPAAVAAIDSGAAARTLQKLAGLSHGDPNP